MNNTSQLRGTLTRLLSFAAAKEQTLLAAVAAGNALLIARG